MVIFLIHDGIEKITTPFNDDASGRIIKRNYHEKLKRRTLD